MRKVRNEIPQGTLSDAPESSTTRHKGNGIHSNAAATANQRDLSEKGWAATWLFVKQPRFLDWHTDSLKPASGPREHFI